MDRITHRAGRIALLVALIAMATIAGPAAGSSATSAEPDATVHPIAVMPATAGAVARPIPVGAFCPARPTDPLREASAFGLTALLMWGLVRHRERRAAGA